MQELKKHVPHGYVDLEAGDLLYNPDWQWHTVRSELSDSCCNVCGLMLLVFFCQITVGCQLVCQFVSAMSRWHFKTISSSLSWPSPTRNSMMLDCRLEAFLHHLPPPSRIIDFIGCYSLFGDFKLVCMLRSSKYGDRVGFCSVCNQLHIKITMFKNANLWRSTISTKFFLIHYPRAGPHSQLNMIHVVIVATVLVFTKEH